MITFIKSNTLSNIKCKFLLLYLLNVLDIFFTLALLRTGYFQEVNPVMQSMIEDPILSLIVKLLLPALLLIYLSLRITQATPRQLKIANYLINAMNLVYFIIFCFHILWTILAVYLSLILL